MCETSFDGVTEICLEISDELSNKTRHYWHARDSAREPSNID